MLFALAFLSVSRINFEKNFYSKIIIKNQFKKYYLLKIRNKLLIKFVYYYNLKIVIEGNFYSLRTLVTL